MICLEKINIAHFILITCNEVWHRSIVIKDNLTLVKYY